MPAFDFTLDIFFYSRQHIIDETGDHFLVVEPNEYSMSETKRLRLREQLKRTSHYMTGKGRYYPKDKAAEPIIDLVL